MGDPAGCVVCHNGDPSETEDKAIAHGGSFFADPGSPWINKQTCGQCHEDQVRVQWQSLMMTEAGKIQGVAWAFGSLTGYEHKWGNYAVKNPESLDDRLFRTNPPRETNCKPRCDATSMDWWKFDSLRIGVFCVSQTRRTIWTCCSHPMRQVMSNMSRQS